MTTLLRQRATAAWGVLVAATLVSWWLGDGHGSARLATVGVLLVAFVKVQLVGHYFMDLRAAPAPLRAVFAAWCIGVCAVLVVIYLM